MSLQGKRVLVTGGNGFLGRYVCKELLNAGCEVIAPSHADCDLTQEDATKACVRDSRPDIVIHAAALCGGIGANARQPADFLWMNTAMAWNTVGACHCYDVPKFVAIGSVCMYPKNCQVPFKEDDIWNGYPEETNAPYGIAKRLLLEMAQAYRKQYGFNAITLIPANLYGPGDNFDLETSHVIPALIRKAVAAMDSSRSILEVWGSGQPTREFLHVKDAARAIVLAAGQYDDAEPVNIGNGREVSINELTRIVCRAVGFEREIFFDESMPNGQPRRCLDVSRAKQFGFEAQISLEDGIRETVEWYKANRCEVAA